MAKVTDMALGVKYLKDLWKKERNPRLREYISFSIDLFEGMPTQDAEESIDCGSCAYRNHETNRCIHKNGLGGKVYPGMYCSYATYDFSDTYGEDEDDEDFSEFNEEE